MLIIKKITNSRLLQRCTGLWGVVMAVMAVCLPSPGSAEPRDRVKPAIPLKAEPFIISEVTLLDGPFKTLQKVMGEKILALNPDSLLAYPRLAAGLPPKAKPDPVPTFHWGTTVGHNMIQCVFAWQATGDPRMLDRVKYLIAGLAECQKANTAKGDPLIGYCGGVEKSREGFAKLMKGEAVAEPAGGFNGMSGVPWYNTHKIYAGLVYAARGGVKEALPVLTALTDWCERVTRNLDDKAMQTMLETEHGGMAEAIADVYALTGEKRYLALARRFRHDAIYKPMLENRDVLGDANPYWAWGWHANTQIPKLTGYERIYELTGESDYHAAVLNFWRIVVNHHTYVTGGNGKAEYFISPDKWEGSVRMPWGPESCNTYNMLKLTSRLFRADPSPEFMEYYERAMFNGMLVMVNPRTGGRVYHTALCPMAYVSSMLPVESTLGSCCGNTVCEMHFLAHELIYAHSASALWVNQFIASEVKWKERGITLRQETRFPYEPRATLRIAAGKPQRFDLMLRRPAWAGEGFAIAINGKPFKADGKPGEYIRLSREWSGGDTVTVELPMALRVEPLKNSSRFAAVFSGPILLAASHGDPGFPEALRNTQKGQGPYGKPEEWSVLVGSIKDIPARLEPMAGQPLHFKTKKLARPADLVFKPFFEMIDERYSVYLPLMDEAAWSAEAARRVQFEAAEKALGARTLDALSFEDRGSWEKHKLTTKIIDNYPGDGLLYWVVRSNPGSELGCDLKIDPKGNNTLVLRIWEGTDYIGCKEFADKGDWRCKILVDGKLLADERGKPGATAGRRDLILKIPQELAAGKSKVTIIIQSCPWTWGPSIFEIRTLKEGMS